MIDLTKIRIEKDPFIYDGNIDMVDYIFEFRKESKSIKTLYCSYEHNYSIQSAARELGLFKRKAPEIKSIKIKFIKNYGRANERNHDRD
jgi:hypothetical protein